MSNSYIDSHAIALLVLHANKRDSRLFTQVQTAPQGRPFISLNFSVHWPHSSSEAFAVLHLARSVSDDLELADDFSDGEETDDLGQNDASRGQLLVADGPEIPQRVHELESGARQYRRRVP
jgi:hypothetical protein